MVYLPLLFEEFCKYFDGKLRWGMSDDDWTQLILRFFEQQAARENMLVENGYMSVDQVWRGKPYEIVLALEHENVGRDANEMLNKEVAHLIDLRARLKVGIFYPNTGDERILMNGISLRISNAAGGVQIPGEQYMFILGFTTRKQGQPAIRFNAYILDERGIETVHREQVILQAPKPESDQPP